MTLVNKLESNHQATPIRSYFPTGQAKTQSFFLFASCHAVLSRRSLSEDGSNILLAFLCVGGFAFCFLLFAFSFLL